MIDLKDVHGPQVQSGPSWAEKARRIKAEAVVKANIRFVTSRS